MISRFLVNKTCVRLKDFIAMDFGKFNMPWHRDYCYKRIHMEALIKSVMWNTPIAAFHYNKSYLVDGAQRITTLRLFVDNQFDIKIGKKKFYFKDLDMFVRKLFLNYSIDTVEIKDATVDELIQYHYIVNYNGHRSRSHRAHVQELISQMVPRG